MLDDREYRCPVCGDDTSNDTECYERAVTADEMDHQITNAGWCALNRYRWRLRQTGWSPFDDVLELQDGKNEASPDDWVDRDKLDPQWISRAKLRAPTAWGADVNFDTLTGLAATHYPRHDKPPSLRDPSHGKIDRDIQWHVEAMRPSTLAQRVAMEATLQTRRGFRKRSVVDAIGLSSQPTEAQLPVPDGMEDGLPDDDLVRPADMPRVRRRSSRVDVTGPDQQTRPATEAEVAMVRSHLSRQTGIPEHLLEKDLTWVDHGHADGPVPESKPRSEGAFPNPIYTAASAIRQTIFDAYEEARADVEKRLNAELAALGWGHLEVEIYVDGPLLPETPDHSPDPDEGLSHDGDGVVRFRDVADGFPADSKTRSTRRSNARSTEPGEPSTDPKDRT